MKNLLFVLVLAGLIACGAPAQEGEESPKAGDPAIETAEVDDLEGEEEEVEILPEGALPLPEILAKLEALGYTEIVEAEFEDGVWGVEYVVDGQNGEIHVDPMTGEILPEGPEEPDDD